MKKTNVFLVLFLMSAMLFAQTGTISGTVTNKNGEPLPGANITLEGTSMGAAADADGAYTIANVPLGTYTVSVAFIGYTTATRSVMVGVGTNTVDFALDIDVVAAKAVSVIGSRFARTAEEQAVPVDVYTAQDIRRAGFSETGQILQALAPSFNMPRTTIADGSDSVRPMTLRGLSAGQVLVLVNGKRRHTTALVHVNNSPSRGDTGVDLNAIPAAAIERIEVLRDGAAAQYGSDAIAGVINIVLKGVGTNGQLVVTQGASNHTVDAIPVGYDLYDWEANGEPYEWNPTTEADENGLVTSSDDFVKHDGEVMQVQYSNAFSLGNDGFFMFAGEYRFRGRTNRVGFEGERYYEVESDYWSNDEAEKNRLNPGSDFYVDPQRMIWGDGLQSNIGGFYNAELPQGDRTFYSFGGYTKRHSDTGCYTRQPDQPHKVWLSANPTGYVPHITPDITDISTVVGVRGVFGNWGYDLSSTYGKNDFHFKMFSTNASFGPEKLRTYDIGGFWFDQLTQNLDLTTTVGNIDLAVGAERRSESFRIYAGEQASYANGQYGTSVAGWDAYTTSSDTNGVAYGDTTVLGLNSSNGSGGCQCFSGFKPSNADATINADRSSFAVYADAETEVMTGMRVGLAGRYENYSDFGSNFSYKASLRYEVMDGVILRAAFSSGFRAPALAQAYQSKIATNFLVNDAGEQVAFEVGTFPVDHPVAQALGATELKPEISNNLSAGASVTFAGIKFNFDFYNVAISDRIVLTGNFKTAGGSEDASGNRTYNDDPGSLGAHVYDLLKDNNVPGADFGGGGRFFTNAVNTKTTGFDVVAEYDLDLSSMGALNFNLAYNQTKTEIDGDIITPPELADYGASIFDDKERRTMTTVTPENNMVLTTRYSMGDFGATVRYNKVGKFQSRRTADLWFSAKTIIDLEARYSFGAVTLAVGSKNFTDQTPDKWLGSNNDGAFVYPNFAPYGMNGRYDYMRLSYDF
ncbi:MAG: TonB-dependent receptor domain-containing protein [Fidelibacterota bacterium]